MKNLDKNEIVEGSVEIIDAPLDEKAARKLTEDIKSTTTALYILLKKAHDTKAWLSLGYSSWTEYISKEFDFSRARSYQLINQANVIEEINKASGLNLYITEREARDIKKRLPEITKRLKEDVKNSDLDESEAEEKAREIIKAEKENIDNSEKENIDNSEDYDKSGDDGWDDPNNYEDEDEKGSPAFDENNNYNLSEKDRLIYENLIVTLKIFETMPNPVLFGEKIKKSNVDGKELNELAHKSIDWITKLINEIK